MMHTNDPTPGDYHWLTYLWVLGLSITGGFISFMRKVKAGESRPFNFVELIGEMTTSGFVGIITFWLCEASAINPLITAAMVGITGHMGSRVLFQLERWAAKNLPGSK